MGRFIVVSLGAGLLMLLTDGLLRANPVAARLYGIYKPLARDSVNALAGSLIDLAYGFLMAGIFLLLYPALPGSAGLAKGLSFGVLAWLFRVLMPTVGMRMMLRVPGTLVAYDLASGLAQMALVGLFYGAVLRR